MTTQFSEPNGDVKLSGEASVQRTERDASGMLLFMGTGHQHAPIELYVRDRIRQMLDAGEVTGNEMAQRLGISKGQVSQLRSGKVKAGPDTVEGFRRAFDVSYGDLEKAAAAWAKQNPPKDAVVVYETALPQYGRIPGYEAVEAEARRRAPYLPSEVWARVRAASGASVQELTPEFLIGQANLFAPLVAGKAPLRPDQPGDGLREAPDDGEKPPPPKKRR